MVFPVLVYYLCFGAAQQKGEWLQQKISITKVSLNSKFTQFDRYD